MQVLKLTAKFHIWMMKTAGEILLAQKGFDIPCILNQGDSNKLTTNFLSDYLKFSKESKTQAITFTHI